MLRHAVSHADTCAYINEVMQMAMFTSVWVSFLLCFACRVSDGCSMASGEKFMFKCVSSFS